MVFFKQSLGVAMKPGTLFVALVVAGASITGILWMAGTIDPVAVVKSAGGAAPEGLPIAETGPYPKVVLPETEFNFDVMAVNDEMTHKFIVKNEGEAPLKLKVKGTSCSCTLSDVAKDEIPTGGEAEVELKWTPHAPDMAFEKTADIWTTDPDNRIITFTVKGRVEPMLDVAPLDGWTLENLDRTKPQTVTAEFRSAILDKFTLTSIEPSSESLAVTQEPLTEEELKEFNSKSGYRLKVTLDASQLKVGKIEEHITVETDVKGFATLNFPIRGQFLGSITGLPYTPEGVERPPGMIWTREVLQTALGDVQASEGGTGWYKLIVGDMPEGQKFEVIGTESSMEFVTATVEPLPTPKNNPRQFFVVTFKVKPGVPPGSYQSKQSAQVILKTNHPYASEIKFYVSFNAV
jgi:hypothetical protein